MNTNRACLPITGYYADPRPPGSGRTGRFKFDPGIYAITGGVNTPSGLCISDTPADARQVQAGPRADASSRRGGMYAAQINARAEDFLDTARPVEKQGEAVRGLARECARADLSRAARHMTGQDLLTDLQRHLGDGRAATAHLVRTRLLEAGIVGIITTAPAVHGGGPAACRHTVFDPERVLLTHVLDRTATPIYNRSGRGPQEATRHPWPPPARLVGYYAPSPQEGFDYDVDRLEAMDDPPGEFRFGQTPAAALELSGPADQPRILRCEITLARPWMVGHDYVREHGAWEWACGSDEEDVRAAALSGHDGVIYLDGADMQIVAFDLTQIRTLAVLTREEAQALLPPDRARELLDGSGEENSLDQCTAHGGEAVSRGL